MTPPLPQASHPAFTFGWMASTAVLATENSLQIVFQMNG